MIPPDIPPEQSLIEYPSAFPIKVMGLQVDGFVEAVLAVARHFDPDLDPATIERRPSSNGKYLGLTITVNATSRGFLLQPKAVFTKAAKALAQTTLAFATTLCARMSRAHRVAVLDTVSPDNVEDNLRGRCHLETTKAPQERRHIPRYSMPFFLHLASDVLIETLPSCVDGEHPNLYPDPITANDFLVQRLIEIGLKK